MEKPKTPLQRYRAAKALTLAELRDEIRPVLKISESQLSRIEREGTSSLQTALKLAAATGLPVTAFDRPTERAA